MAWDNKIQRARRAQRQALGLDEEQDEKRRRESEEIKLEKGDLPAMLASSFVMLFLPAVGVLLGLVFLIFLLFGLF